MTPCEKLGYKVGDVFEVINNGGFHCFEVGRRVLLIEDDGTDVPRFEGVGENDRQWVPLKAVKPINSFNAPLKNPIEYLKSAHADGDMIDPATMLRECYGITKTERVVVEWSEAKREFKVGDHVRIVGNKFSSLGYGHCFKIGDVVVITAFHQESEEQPYQGDGSNIGCLSPDDVEPV